MLAIALTVLTGGGCSSSKEMSMRSEVRTRATEVSDSVRVERVAVAVHDTIVEVTTIVIRENEVGDTVRMSRVTERDRVRAMAEVRSEKEEVRVRRDTVYVERKDSAVVKGGEREKRMWSWLGWVILVGVLVWKLKIEN